MKIILATGGSGGHIFPALKTAQRLKSLGHEVLIVGALQFAEDRLKSHGLPYLVLEVQGFKSTSVTAVLSFAYLMIKSMLRCCGLLSSFKPDVVVGFGSYSSFPVVLSASLKKIPVLVHEQNVIPGKANRLSFRFARKIAVTFEETKKYVNGRDIVWTGCPCNDQRSTDDKNQLLAKFNLEPGRTTILVLGGSQGSRHLNEVVFESIPYLQAQQDVQIIHMTGRLDYSLYVEKYRSLNVPNYVGAFIENIQEAYSVADLVIARAGAGTVCELAAFGLPSILVPYPFAHAHQTANAQQLEKAGAAVLIEQKALTRAKLVEAVEALLQRKMASPTSEFSAGQLFPSNPTDRLVSAITELKR
jgi:UDP-N-acetylglucosamine--N-acetylmuramyl-(pentapeptide) pyrophosphoryl-undecaprenol N-acetylglucosamine transferase